MGVWGYPNDLIEVQVVKAEIRKTAGEIRRLTPPVRHTTIQRPEGLWAKKTSGRCARKSLVRSPGRPSALIQARVADHLVGPAWGLISRGGGRRTVVVITSDPPGGAGW